MEIYISLGRNKILFTIKAYSSFRNSIIIVPVPVVLEVTEIVGLVVIETATVSFRVEAVTVPESAVSVFVWALVVTV